MLFVKYGEKIWSIQEESLLYPLKIASQVKLNSEYARNEFLHLLFQSENNASRLKMICRYCETSSELETHSLLGVFFVLLFFHFFILFFFKGEGLASILHFKILHGLYLVTLECFTVWKCGWTLFFSEGEVWNYFIIGKILFLLIFFSCNIY